MIFTGSRNVSQTPSKSSNVPVTKAIPKRFNVQQNQVDNALELQRDANVLLRKMVSQNDETLCNQLKMMSLLEKLIQK